MITAKEVQSIVYDDPNRLLGETKKILEQRVKQYKKKKMQFAVLYAAAVISLPAVNKGITARLRKAGRLICRINAAVQPVRT